MLCTARILAVLTIAVPAAIASPIDFPPIDFDFLDWWTSQAFQCPLWKGEMPTGAANQQTSCSNIWTRSHTVGSITTRVYQVPGGWQQGPRYQETVNGINAAVKKGLDIFGTFVNSPLTINIGILNNMIGDDVQTDLDNNGVKTPCYILTKAPSTSNNYPLLHLQKDIVRGMYYCVEQFHHPNAGAMADGNEWWRKGIARYFDGLAYPTTTGIINEGVFPEEYQRGVALYQNEEAAALFFHFVDGNGWSPAEVNSWMKAHVVQSTYDAERLALSTDARVLAQFHKFMLAFNDGNVKYPNGNRIPNTLGGLGSPTVNGVVDLSVGEELEKTLRAAAFKAYRFVFPIRAGQKMRVSLTQLEPGVEWSIRKVGTAAWNSGSPGRSVEVVAAVGANTNYEILVTSTRDDAGGSYPRALFVRIP